MAKNLTFNLKKRLKAGEKAFGTLIGWGNEPEPTVEALKDFGFDMLILDMEHSLIDKREVIGYLRAAKKAGIPLLLRPEENYSHFRAYLDAGIEGLILPHVDTVEQAVYGLNQTYYPPLGHRGLGISASPYLVDPKDIAKVPLLGLTEYINNNTMLFPQTESRQSISNLRHILELEGITGTWVGAYDLAYDMGAIDSKALMTEALNSEAVAEKLREVVRICRETGKVAGIGGFSPKGCARWAKEGYQLFSIGYVTDGKVDKVKPLIDEARALIK
jgi:2-keto-3-deoxy-L-rhamnonate aldolase RhmA